MATARKTSVHSSSGHRRDISLRVILAILGGYCLVNTLGILLAYLLPLTKSDAVMTAILLSFAVYAGCVIWVFAVQTLAKAALGLLLPAALFGLLALLMKVAGVAP